MDIFSNNIQSGDLLTAETFQNIHSFLKGSSVSGGAVSAQGINVPSEFARNPRTVRFVAEETIKTFSIIELTGQVEETDSGNQVPTFKARPANGDSGTLFYTEFSFAEKGGTGLAYSLGGEPILIRSTATSDGTPSNGEVVEQEGGIFRYLSHSDVKDLNWFLPVQGGGTVAPPSLLCTVILPICRAINPNAQADPAMPFGNTYQTQHNSRTHYAAQCGYVAVDGKTYQPRIAFVENEGEENEIVHYFKNLRVSSDVNILNGIPEGVTGINAHYRVVDENRTEVLQRPVIVYAEENGNEWKPWEDGVWETTTDPEEAWKNYDLAACPTLDYSEVLVPGERVKFLRTETHLFYRRKEEGERSSNVGVADDSLLLTPFSLLLTIVEPPATYTVEFEGTSDALEFGIWNKERMLTNNRFDVVRICIDENLLPSAVCDLPSHMPYDYWGFDTVDLLPDGTASWHFVDIAAFPKLEKIQKPSPPEPEPLCECETPDPDIDGICMICGLPIDPPPEPPSSINDTWVSRPILTDTVSISNTACNTHAYGLWYKTDRDGVRYPILCNVESLTAGTVIETRKVNCYVHSGGDCVPTWNIFKFKIERKGTRLLLPDVYCAVNCVGAKSNAEVVIP